jgi:hypothetical protein
VAPSKLENAKSAAWADNEVCSKLYGEYGEAVKAASGKGVASDKDDDAKKALKALNGQYDRFAKSVDDLQKEIDKVPVNSPDSPKAVEAQKDVDLYKKVGLVVYKRAEDFWTKKYPVKKK